MSNRIIQLSSEVANQIAAGEVIERPAGAVKELVENALDAGARRITIDIEEGGKKLIRVRDDGSGMSAGDAVLSLQRHATSKIAGADDLWRIATLGFRGEALPSLAAVSRIEIVTREVESDIGTQLVVEAGQVVDLSEVGGAPGTEITVRGLFFNTPARFKFLKSDAAEAARISEMIGHLALAYPAVSFVLKHNGNEQLRVEAGGDAFNALVAVLGRETARQMLPISTSQEFENISVSGFAGRPQLTRANRNGQLFFVNGRLIKNRALQHAFGAAYEGLTHGRDRFPLGVLMLQVAPGMVDVNVHPTKSEVRFAKENEAHHAVRVAVRDTLVGAQLAPSWGLGETKTDAGALYGPFGRTAPPENSPPTEPAPVTRAALYTPPAGATPNYSMPLAPVPTDDDRERFRQRRGRHVLLGLKDRGCQRGGRSFGGHCRGALPHLIPGMSTVGALNVASGIRNCVVRHFILGFTVRANQTHSVPSKPVSGSTMEFVTPNSCGSKGLSLALVQSFTPVRWKAQS